MKKRFRGYASWLRLFDDHFPFGTSGKLATLWFDEIVLQVPREDAIKGAMQYALSCSDRVQEELEQIWIPVTKRLPDYHFLERPFKSKKKELISVACKVTDEETKKEWSKQRAKFSPKDFGFLHETAWASAGLIDAVNVWMRLNEKSPFVFLPTLRERKVLQQIFSEATQRKPLELFSRILTCRIPDLSKYSWDKVIELRHHDFLDRFREKMVELSSELSLMHEKRGARNLIDEIFRADMEQMIKLFRPSPKLSAFEAFASNVPLPIPINPLGIIISANEIRKQRAVLRKYGWLYFLIDLPKKPRKAP
jgi:hypothetical protein